MHEIRELDVDHIVLPTEQLFGSFSAIEDVAEGVEDEDDDSGDFGDEQIGPSLTFGEIENLCIEFLGPSVRQRDRLSSCRCCYLSPCGDEPSFGEVGSEYYGMESAGEGDYVCVVEGLTDR